MRDPLIGQRLGNYRIDSVIGRGGMATVYHGWDEGLHRPVALKVIDARYRDDPAYTERFIQEARAVAAWRHDNILQVFYAGQQDDLYYFAMEYVDGLDLARVMKQYASDKALMPHEDVLKIGRAIANALDYAHSRGIIHRDVKPSNVMVAKDGRVTLTDFGLALDARQGSFGGTFGSPHYVAPEQARNSAAAVPQSDLYALGVILYEMLTGSIPFNDPSPTTLAIQHLTLPPPPPRQLNPNLNEAVEKTLLRALSKQPADRFQSGAALIDALAAALNIPEALPLPPASVAVPVLSQLSVAERVSLYMPPPPPSVQQTAPPELEPMTLSNRPNTAPGKPNKRKRTARLFAAGILMLLLLVVGWALSGWGGGSALASLFIAPSPTVSAVIVPPPTETPTPTETAQPPTATPEPPTATAEPTPTTPPPNTPTVQPTDAPTTQPTATPTAQPTAAPTLASTSPPPTETPIPLPTPTPDGLRAVMFYNSVSFYLYNPSTNTNIRVIPLVFESLDENDQFSGYRFEGLSWSEFNNFVNPRNCVRLELPVISGWLRPSQCRDYNATYVLEQDNDWIFWIARSNVTAFRVLWEEEEIGRCDVAAEQCEVYLP